MWLIKAAGGMLALAVVFAYIAICVLFYHAQWQLVLHPAHTDSHQPAEYGVSAEPVRFGPDASGQPQLRGWWIAADAPAGASTVLMLPAGDGSAGDWLARAKTLHDTHLNVLLFDYRGFGASAGQHPTEASMEQDAASALAFLQARGVTAASTIVFGAGAGASLAALLCAEHPELAALILEQPDGDFEPRARVDTRARMVPFGLLFHENFPLADRLHELKMPKLLITYSAGPLPAAIQRAGDPKMVLEVPSASAPGVADGLRRFLDMYATKH